jgi:hypothetical protein
MYSTAVLSSCVLADAFCFGFVMSASTALGISSEGGVGRKGGGLGIGVNNGIGLDGS